MERIQRTLENFGLYEYFKAKKNNGKQNNLIS